ncbi:MAG TPA: TolC family protein [Polyangia bacterium]
MAFATLMKNAPAKGAPSPSPSMDVGRYVEAVLSASLSARVADAEMAVARADGAGVGAWANPTLGWQREAAGAGASSGPAVTQDIFALSWTLALSGRLGLERQAARMGADAATATRLRVREELRYEARRRFHSVLAASERRGVFESSVAALRALEANIAARERAGDASGYDRLRMSVEVGAVEGLARGAAIEERTAKAMALGLLGPDVKVLPPFIGSLAGSLAEVTPERPDPATLRALEERRPDLRALTLEAQAAEVAERAAARSWIPDPTIVAGAQVLDAGRPEEKRGYVVGLELPFPIFQRRQGEQARAAARRTLSEAKRAALTREIGGRVDALVEEVAARQARLAAHRSQVLLPAEELRRIAHSAYRGGASDLLVLVDAERAAREARLTAVLFAEELAEAVSQLSLLTGAAPEPAKKEKP